MKTIRNICEVLIIAAVICAVFASCGGSVAKRGGFAIYLTRDDIPPAQMPALAHFDLADEPVVGISDIVSYDAGTHQITLLKSAFDRIAKLEVPVRGTSFIVCVNKEPRYWGAFWTPISSISFNGVTIWKPLGSDQPLITLQLGYPSSEFYKGEDPRNNPDVIKSLDQAGKLINKQSTVPSEELPRSMKGYELYSWLEDGKWQFTLITGTNRNKTLEEIIANSKPLSQDGWVQIHVSGVDAIKKVLSKVPQNEWVSWLGSLRSDQPSQSSINLTFPDSTIVDSLKLYAEQCGLNFSASTTVSR